jgi:CheY-like chemotaxis protein
MLAELFGWRRGACERSELNGVPKSGRNQMANAGCLCPQAEGLTVMRILLADDHNVVRRGLRTLLESRPGWEVCGEASNGREAIELAEKLKPDVVVIDISMPELNWLEATREIRKKVPGTEVLIFTLHDSEYMAGEAVEAGAHGLF